MLENKSMRRQAEELINIDATEENVKPAPKLAKATPTLSKDSPVLSKAK